VHVNQAACLGTIHHLAHPLHGGAVKRDSVIVNAIDAFVQSNPKLIQNAFLWLF
jgi:hypothetical protein